MMAKSVFHHVVWPLAMPPVRGFPLFLLPLLLVLPFHISMANIVKIAHLQPNNPAIQHEPQVPIGLTIAYWSLLDSILTINFYNIFLFAV